MPAPPSRRDLRVSERFCSLREGSMVVKDQFISMVWCKRCEYLRAARTTTISKAPGKELKQVLNEHTVDDDSHMSWQKLHLVRERRTRWRVSISQPAGKTLPCSTVLCESRGDACRSIVSCIPQISLSTASRGNGQADDKEAQSLFSLENLQLNSTASVQLTSVVELEVICQDPSRYCRSDRVLELWEFNGNRSRHVAGVLKPLEYVASACTEEHEEEKGTSGNGAY